MKHELQYIFPDLDKLEIRGLYLFHEVRKKCQDLEWQTICAALIAELGNIPQNLYDLSIKMDIHDRGNYYVHFMGRPIGKVKTFFESNKYIVEYTSIR